MQAAAEGHTTRSLLIVKIATRVCGIPIESVVEVMRPLPIEAIAGAPAYVLGLAVIRGEPIPVVDLGALLGAHGGQRGRFAVVRAGARRVALLVDSIVAIRAVAETALATLPPLVGGDRHAAIAAVGTLDADLLLVLAAGYLVPDDVWSALH